MKSAVPNRVILPYDVEFRPTDDLDLTPHAFEVLELDVIKAACIGLPRLIEGCGISDSGAVRSTPCECSIGARKLRHALHLEDHPRFYLLDVPRHARGAGRA